MRLWRYADAAGGMQPRMAIAIADRPPMDLLTAWRLVHSEDIDPAEDHHLISMLRFIEAGPAVWRAAESACSEAPDEARVSERGGDVRLLCPLDRAASLRDFLAFEDHVKRGAARRGGEVPGYWYEAPIYYKGNHRALFGPDDDVPWPAYTERLDFELELAMIVGRRGRDLQAGAAGGHVFGFTVFNDLSARDVQSREMSAWLGPAKGKDFANSFGPCIVTADEVGTEPDLEMTCRVNGEEWGRARSSDMHWSWAQMLAHVSAGEDVYPGDVYGSGTPGGCCGLDLGRELAPGDVVELEIEKIGTLRNRITT